MIVVKEMTIQLPEDLAERLSRVAAKAQCTEAELVREVLTEALTRRESRPTTPLFSEGWGDPAIAENVDEFLAKSGLGMKRS